MLHQRRCLGHGHVAAAACVLMTPCSDAVKAALLAGGDSSPAEQYRPRRRGRATQPLQETQSSTPLMAAYALGLTRGRASCLGLLTSAIWHDMPHAASLSVFGTADCEGVMMSSGWCGWERPKCCRRQCQCGSCLGFVMLDTLGGICLGSAGCRLRTAYHAMCALHTSGHEGTL